jgi:hypothetical protein
MPVNRRRLIADQPEENESRADGIDERKQGGKRQKKG